MAVNYTRTNWHNRAVQRPRTYVETTNSDNSVTHTPAPGTVAQEGTPLNEDNLNNMEQGIADCAREINSMLQTLAQMAETLSRYNTRIGNNERGITDIQKVDETQSANIRSVTEAHNALAEDVERDENAANAHYTNYANPHRVSKEQLGLGSVPNVTTNDQRPTFTEASSDQNLASGETLSTSLGKISRGLKRLWAHIARTDNPHSVTKTQVGLGNVPNVTTNNQTPTYSTAEADQELTSGETLAMAFGKLKRGLKRLYEHINDTDNPHELTAASIGAFAPVQGQYTGNGATTREINLGFRPTIVIWCDETGTFADDIKGTCGGIIYRGSPQYVWDIGYGNSSRGDSTKVAEITSTGFKVFNSSTGGHTGRNSNHNGTIYRYIAW